MLEFKTKTGNVYAWDEKTGLFIPFHKTLKAVNELWIENYGLISEEIILENLGKEYDEKELNYCFNWIKKWKKISPSKFNHEHYQNLSITSAKIHILKNGLKCILLNVTEDCNFRCKYCAFSGKYEYRRDHSDNYMKFKTAKKAIDYYFSLINEGIKYNPLRTPTIGFYGGEPLLNFQLIKKCVNYIEKNYNFKDVNYSITTNGSLLTESITKWLIKHQFFLYISLDGPKEEHDRCRVYEDGTGTFKDVMSNISMILNLNYEKLSILPVYDVKSDLFKMEKFFNIKKLPILFVSEVDNFTKNSYYDHFTEEDYLNFENQLKKAENHYLQNIEKYNEQNSLFSHLFGGDIQRDLCNIHSLSQHDPLIKYTATCFPGYKIFIGTDGTFYLCERVSSFFSIGNTDDGLDYKKIVWIMQEYFKHMDLCNKCKIKTRCQYCFRHFETDGGFNFSSKVCKDIELREINSVSKSLDMTESHPTLIDYYSKHKNIKKHWGEKCILN